VLERGFFIVLEVFKITLLILEIVTASAVLVVLVVEVVMLEALSEELLVRELSLALVRNTSVILLSV